MTKNRQLVLLITLGLFAPLRLLAIEEKYYSGSEADFKKVSGLISNADRTIRLVGDGVQGPYTMNLGKIEGDVHRLIKFSLQDLDTFLKDEKHKDCLVITLSKFFSLDDERNERQNIRKLLLAFKSYGYKKIIIIRDNSIGGIDVVGYSSIEKRQDTAIPQKGGK